MNKTEFENIEYHIKDIETTDEGNDALESLYTYIKQIYREYCDKHGIKSLFEREELTIKKY